MRHNYVNKLDSYITRLSTEARSAGDVKEIARRFPGMMGTVAIAVAGTFIEPTTATLLSAGALYRAKVEYRAARNKTLEEHSHVVAL